MYCEHRAAGDLLEMRLSSAPRNDVAYNTVVIPSLPRNTEKDTGCWLSPA
jgi:hypothetical protein